MNKNHCLECGRGEIEFRKVKNFETMVKGVPFTVPEASMGFCKSCGAKIFDPNEIRRWQQLYEANLLLEGKFLSAAEITKIRETLGLQISQFARLLGTTRQSVYNWERENRISPQLRLADLLLRLIHESMKVGAIDVVEFLREQAGMSEIAQGVRHRRTRLSRRRRIVSLRRRESCEYDRIFGPSDAPNDLPRLQMC
jgi:putative zinc finger/helix-turn-helix YgiT family protein